MPKQNYIVYALASIHRNYIYVGLTANLEKRLHRHNNGHEKTTKPYAPFEVIYTEHCNDRPAARIREKFWKSSSGKKRLRIIRDKRF